jgi:hypothetical protein
MDATRTCMGFIEMLFCDKLYSSIQLDQESPGKLSRPNKTEKVLITNNVASAVNTWNGSDCEFLNFSIRTNILSAHKTRSSSVK